MVKDKIAKLRALAYGNANAHEALAATLAADKLQATLAVVKHPMQHTMWGDWYNAR